MIALLPGGVALAMGLPLARASVKSRVTHYGKSGRITGNATPTAELIDVIQGGREVYAKGEVHARDYASGECDQKSARFLPEQKVEFRVMPILFQRINVVSDTPNEFCTEIFWWPWLFQDIFISGFKKIKIYARFFDIATIGILLGKKYVLNVEFLYRKPAKYFGRTGFEPTVPRRRPASSCCRFSFAPTFP
jgi:hypothetical protein